MRYSHRNLKVKRRIWVDVLLRILARRLFHNLQTHRIRLHNHLCNHYVGKYRTASVLVISSSLAVILIVVIPSTWYLYFGSVPQAL